MTRLEFLLNWLINNNDCLLFILKTFVCCVTTFFARNKERFVTLTRQKIPHLVKYSEGENWTHYGSFFWPAHLGRRLSAAHFLG